MTATMTRTTGHDSGPLAQDIGLAASSYPLDVLQNLPNEISLGVGEYQVDVPRLASKRDTLWYSFVSSKGNALRGGIQVPHLATGLPHFVTVAGNRVDCRPVHKWDKAKQRYLDSYEDFDAKRIAEGRVVIDGIPMTARVLLSIRRDGRMNVTARIWPEDPITATADVPTNPGAHHKPGTVRDKCLPLAGATTLTDAQARLRDRLDWTETL